MEKTPRAFAFGEILYDVFADGAYLGGAPLNFAWYLRQFGITVGMVSALGNDPYGADARKVLRTADIDQRFVTTNQLPTGTVDVRLTDGQPDYTINLGVAWDAIEAPESNIVPELLYYGTLAQRTEPNRITLANLVGRHSEHRFFDVNLRQKWYSDDIIESGLRNATIAKLNDDEWVHLQYMTGAVVPPELVARFGLKALIVTHGGDGASVYENNDVYNGRGPVVEVVDAVGAGDSFSATIAAAVLQDVPLQQALAVACDVGAFVVSRRGAQATLPDGLKQAFG